MDNGTTTTTTRNDTPDIYIFLAVEAISFVKVTAILGFVSFGSDLADTASWIFSLITTIMLIVFAVKAFQGKPIHIESVQDLTDWIEDKIKPQQ